MTSTKISFYELTVFLYSGAGLNVALIDSSELGGLLHIDYCYGWYVKFGIMYAYIFRMTTEG
jgi:hypothetical protein